MNFVNFQLIDTGDFYNKIFRLDPDSPGNNPFNSQFEMMGYGSLYIVQNFGMLCITLFVPFVARILASVTVFLCSGRSKIWRVDLSQIKQKSERWLQYGFWISFFDETYLFLLVCACLNLRGHFEWYTGGDAMNSLLALLFGILMVIFPIFVAIFYRTNSNLQKIREGNADFIARYGSVIDGLNFKRRYRWVLLFPCL